MALGLLTIELQVLDVNYQLRAATETPIASDICCLAERILHRYRLS
jgi:hypothetical protein